MENISAYAIRRIKEEIPREILQAAFVRRGIDQTLYTHVTLEAAIKAAVLMGSVYMDIQLLTGRECNIDLTGIEPNYNSDGSATITVPLNRTGGKDILEVYHVGYFNSSTTSGVGAINTHQISQVDTKLNAVIDNTVGAPITGTSDCTMIAPNVIHVNLYKLQPSILNATVNLSVDKEMGHIPPTYYDAFGSLCVEKCKQYIYTLYRVNLDRGRIERGTELGAFSEEIQEYRDAKITYRELLKTWRRSEQYLNQPKLKKVLGWITPSII